MDRARATGVDNRRTAAAALLLQAWLPHTHWAHDLSDFFAAGVAAVPHSNATFTLTLSFTARYTGQRWLSFSRKARSAGEGEYGEWIVTVIDAIL